jgi:hypothetical protein
LPDPCAGTGTLLLVPILSITLTCTTTCHCVLHNFNMQLDLFGVSFLTWWLNQVLVVLSYGSELAANTPNTSCLHHIAAASLAAEYKDPQHNLCLWQGGHCIDPKFLDLLKDNKVQYYFW